MFSFCSVLNNESCFFDDHIISEICVCKDKVFAGKRKKFRCIKKQDTRMMALGKNG